MAESPPGDGSDKNQLFCRHCGNKLANDAKFCPKCGTTVSDETAQATANKKTGWSVVKRTIVIILCTLGLITLVGIGGGLWVHYSQESKAPRKQAAIEDVLTEILVAKSIGDALVLGQIDPANQSGPNFSDVQRQARGASKTIRALEKQYGEDEQTRAIRAFIDSVLAASSATDFTQWNNLPTGPAPVSRVFGDDAARNMIDNRVDSLARYKEFGDASIQLANLTAFRYIQAHIVAQRYTLGSGPSDLSNICSKEDEDLCLDDIEATLAKLETGVNLLLAGDLNGAVQWSQAWAELPQELRSQVEQEVAISEEDGQVVYGPLSKAFFESCRTRSGEISETKGIKRGVPTTEAGYTCWFGPDDNLCWDFLTFSGRSYRGGEKGCEQLGLVEPDEPDVDISGRALDGDYVIRFKLDCDFSGPGGVVHDTSYSTLNVVVNNRVAADVPETDSGTIDENGQLYFPPATEDGATSEQTFLFVLAEDGSVTVTGYGQASGEIEEGVHAECSQTATGERTAKRD